MTVATVHKFSQDSNQAVSGPDSLQSKSSSRQIGVTSDVGKSISPWTFSCLIKTNMTPFRKTETRDPPVTDQAWLKNAEADLPPLRLRNQAEMFEELEKLLGRSFIDHLLIDNGRAPYFMIYNASS